MNNWNQVLERSEKQQLSVALKMRLVLDLCASSAMVLLALWKAVRLLLVPGLAAGAVAASTLDGRYCSS